MSTLERLDALVDSLQEERALAETARQTAATDAGLDRAILDVTRARTRRAQGDEQGAVDVLAIVGRQVGDSWSYTSRLAVEVLAVGQQLRGR